MVRTQQVWSYAQLSEVAPLDAEAEALRSRSINQPWVIPCSVDTVFAIDASLQHVGGEGRVYWKI